MKRKRDKDYFEAICGVNPRKPLCYLLHFEGFNILLDCGVPIRNNKDQKRFKAKLSKITPTLDIILLSHSSFSNICGLPLLLSALPETTDIFATEPTNKMGEMTMYDYYINLSNVADLNLHETLNTVDEVFKRIKELKYTETRVVKREDKNQVIRIQPFNSGHSLGGTVWKITNDIDTVVYCVDYDIKQTNYLNGMDMRVFETKPTLLILDSRLSNETVPKKSEMKILNIIKKTVKEGNGNILIPSDTSGRALELVCLLEKWFLNDSEGIFRNVKLLFLTNMSKRTISTYASQMLHFMSDDVNDQFMKHRKNPFSLRKCKLSQKISDLSEMSSNIVIASSKDLELGFAREIFLKWVQNDRNSIILTELTEKGSLSFRISQFLRMNRNLPASLELTHRVKEPLSGEAFEQYKQKKIKERQEEMKRKQEEDARKQMVTIHDEDYQSQQKMIQIQQIQQQQQIEEEEEIKREEEEENEEQLIRRTTSSEEVKHHPRLFLPENMIYRSRFLMFPPRVEEEIESDEFGQLVDVDHLKEISIKMLEQDTQFSSSKTKEEEQQQQNKNIKKKNKRRRRRGIVDDDDDDDDDSEEDDDINLMIDEDVDDIEDEKFRRRKRRMMMIDNNNVFSNMDDDIDDEEYHHQQQQQQQNKRKKNEIRIDPQTGEIMIEPPLVVVEKVIRIRLGAKFHYVPYEGRAGRDSVRNILNRVTPQQLILVHGESKVKETLKRYCLRQRICKSVVCASTKEKIQVMTEKVVFQVKLALNLVKNVKRFGKYEIGFFEGSYILPDFEEERKKKKLLADVFNSEDGDIELDVNKELESFEEEQKKSEEDAYPVIMKRDENLGHSPIFIGDVPLNEFKDVLNRRGITTQFKFGGGLICNDVVLITKDANRKIGIHGPLCKEYLIIRKILYEQYNIL